MAKLLDIGDFPFLAVKLAVGFITAFVLWRWSEKKLAKIGLTLALTVYVGLMGVHFVTGLSAAGLISQTMIENVSNWTKSILAFAF